MQLRRLRQSLVIMMPFMFVVEIDLRPGGTGMVLGGPFHLIWTGTHALSIFSAELKNGSHLDELFTLLQMKGHQDSSHLSQSGLQMCKITTGFVIPIVARLTEALACWSAA